MSPVFSSRGKKKAVRHPRQRNLDSVLSGFMIGSPNFALTPRITVPLDIYVDEDLIPANQTLHRAVTKVSFLSNIQTRLVLQAGSRMSK